MRSSAWESSVGPGDCAHCAFLSLCGGLDQGSFFGCYACAGSCRSVAGCDYVCPGKSDFWRDWAEVGGLNPQQQRELPGIGCELPTYIPMIRHGYSRSEPLPFDFVALNTFDVLDSGCRLRESTADGLRDYFRISPRSKVLLVSANKDALIENLWARWDTDMLTGLANLRIAAITAPNFSFFDDAPRLHNVRNAWRIRRCAEDLAGAGIPPVLHVNALTREDWGLWSRVLKENPSVRHICKEFRTGFRDPDRAKDAVAGLARLQDDVGRELHPIIVGGLRVARALNKSFRAFTIVDSVPFFVSVNRKRILANGQASVRVDNPTSSAGELDQLMQDNIRAYQTVVAACSTRHVEIPDDFDFDDDWGTAEEVRPLASAPRRAADLGAAKTRGA